MNKINGLLRIGPHNIDIESMIVGSLLGDAHCERRCFNTNEGLAYGNTRIVFKQGSLNIEYLYYLWKFISDRGYSSLKKPKLKKVIIKGNKICYYIKFNTWTYSSFNYYNNIFYVKGKKIIPINIYEILTPMALAIWIMDNGSKHITGGINIHTNCFSFEDVSRLVLVLNKKYNLLTKVIPKKSEGNKYYIIYISRKSMVLLNKLILPFMCDSMLLKLHLDLI